MQGSFLWVAVRHSVIFGSSAFFRADMRICGIFGSSVSPFLFLLAIHSLLVEIELRSVFVQPCSYFSAIWTAKRLDFGILGCGCGFGLVSGSAVSVRFRGAVAVAV